MPNWQDALADSAFTRPMVENGFGDVAHRSDFPSELSVRKLIITCGASGAIIQFYLPHDRSDCIVAINNGFEAQIFNVADYCIVDDLYQVVPELTELIKSESEGVIKSWHIPYKKMTSEDFGSLVIRSVTVRSCGTVSEILQKEYYRG